MAFLECYSNDAFLGVSTSKSLEKVKKVVTSSIHVLIHWEKLAAVFPFLCCTPVLKVEIPSGCTSNDLSIPFSS